jgi:hypothetical protein
MDFEEPSATIPLLSTQQQKQSQQQQQQQHPLTAMIAADKMRNEEELKKAKDVQQSQQPMERDEPEEITRVELLKATTPARRKYKKRSSSTTVVEGEGTNKKKKCSSTTAAASSSSPFQFPGKMSSPYFPIVNQEGLINNNSYLASAGFPPLSINSKSLKSTTMKSLQGINQYQQQQQQQSSLYFNQIPLAWSSLFSPSPKLQSIGPLIAAVDARSRLPVGGKIDNPSSMITVLPQLNPTYSSSKQPAFSPKRSPLTGPLPSLNPNNISSLAIQIDGTNPLLEKISSELLLPSLPPQLLSKENAPRISKHQASPEAYLSSFSTSSSSPVTPSSSSFQTN